MKFILLISLMGVLTVSVRGQASRPVDDLARWSEHGNIHWRDERIRLDRLASQFRKSSGHVIHFLVYAGNNSCKDEARLRALRAKSYLVRHHSIPSQSISWGDGGFLPELSFEIWLLQPDQQLPVPHTFMTMDPSVAKARQNCAEYRRSRVK